MTRRPHDALIKAAFEIPKDAADLFRGGLQPELVDAIAWDTIRGEPGVLVDSELADFYTDLLFSAQLGEHRVLLYLLLEHKSTPERDTMFQLLVYVTRIWERWRTEHSGVRLPVIVPLVVSHSPGGWTAPRTFWELVEPDPAQLPGMGEFVPSFSCAVLDLSRWSDGDIKARVLSKFPQLALWALRDASNAGRLLENLGRWASALREVMRAPTGLRSLAQFVRYVSLVTDDLHYAQFRAKLREIVPEAEPAIMTIAEELRQEGRQQGLQQGKKQMLLKQLQLKFVTLSDEDVARVEAADDAALERYVERVLTAESVAAVLQD